MEPRHDSLQGDVVGFKSYLAAVEIMLASFLAPRIGWDMIEQSSEDADLREALKNSMSTQGIIAALFLTVVWAMLQADPIQGDATLIISQWYSGLLVLSISFTMIGTVTSSMCCWSQTLWLLDRFLAVESNRLD